MCDLAFFLVSCAMMDSLTLESELQLGTCPWVGAAASSKFENEMHLNACVCANPPDLRRTDPASRLQIQHHYSEALMGPPARCHRLQVPREDRTNYVPSPRLRDPSKKNGISDQGATIIQFLLPDPTQGKVASVPPLFADVQLNARMRQIFRTWRPSLSLRRFCLLFI